MATSYEYCVFQILYETLKILYRFSTKGSEFGIDVNGDVTVFSKEQSYSLLYLPTPRVLLAVQFIFVDLNELKRGVFKERNEHTVS